MTTGLSPAASFTSALLNDPKLNLSVTTKTNSYTPSSSDISDNGKLVVMNVGSANNFNVPTNASNPYVIGTQIHILQRGSGQTTIAAVDGGTTTVNGTPGLKLRAQWSLATLIKIDTDVWVLIGDTSA